LKVLPVATTFDRVTDASILSTHDTVVVKSHR